MAHKASTVSLAIISAALASAPAVAQELAPPGNPDTRYCLRVEPITGSHIAGVACYTRAEWAEGNVDVDKAWAEDGVAVQG
jgi:hypothetical protein